MSDPFTRKRNITFFSGRGTLTTVPTVGAAFTTYYPCELYGAQRTVSKDNPDWHITRRLLFGRDRNGRAHPLRPELRQMLRGRDIGGYFQTTTNFHSHSHPRWSSTGNSTFGTKRGYSGPLFAYSQGPVPSWVWPELTAPSILTLYAKGTTAIARTIPTNPVAGVAVALGELREGVPKIPLKSLSAAHRRRYQDIGGEYLNVTFGWAPMVRDVQKTAKAVKDSKSIIDQYARDSGRHVRRRYNFPEEVSVQVTDLGQRGVFPALPSDVWPTSVQTGPATLTKTTRSQYTFSGCYSYYFDPGLTALGRLKRSEQTANKLYGTRVNPETLWALTPWSWLADWAGNTGDVMTNISALSRDSLVLRWGYIMLNQTITHEYSINCPMAGTVTQTFGTRLKMRVRATPYGFGLNPVDFSNQRWAILAALGISRGPRSL